MSAAAEQFVLLGLRLGKHVDGLVDAYYGPPELKEQVDAEEATPADELVAQGDALLAVLDDGWLRDQAVGLRTYAGVLAGEGISYSDEVERCYGIRPERRSTDVYAAMHEQLEELLPGTGDLAERYEAWRQSHLVPADKVVPLTQEVMAALRERTVEIVDLPEGEGLVVEEVHDEPWWAFNYFQGGLRSRVVVNLDVPTTMDDVVELSAHEVYPGHHTEHAVKEQLLLRDRGQIEESIQLVPVPAALLQEGVAETAPEMVVDEETAERLRAIFAGHGLEYDRAGSFAMRQARRPARGIGVDVALLIHEDGVPADEAAAFSQKWALATPEQAAHNVRFVTDPTWRAYVINYSAGGELVRRWTNGDPARFRRMLTEHMRVGDLLSSLP